MYAFIYIENAQNDRIFHKLYQGIAASIKNIFIDCWPMTGEKLKLCVPVLVAQYFHIHQSNGSDNHNPLIEFMFQPIPS